MNQERKIKIANSFPSRFEAVSVNIELSTDDYKLLSVGFFSTSMDEKWNIFVIEDHLYFARSWTDHCIFKASIEKEKNSIKITYLLVSRDENAFKTFNLEREVDVFNRMLQYYLIPKTQ